MAHHGASQCATPVAPSRRKAAVQYGRSSSASADIGAFAIMANNRSAPGVSGAEPSKPPPVPRTSLIRSQTAAEVIHHKAAAAAVVAAAAARQQANNRILSNSYCATSVPPPGPQQQPPLANGTHAQEQRTLITSPAPSVVSRSFSVVSEPGIRTKIPVTPVISTGPKTKPPINHSNNKSSSHSTLTYRHGTLVFGTASTQQHKTGNSNVVSGRLKLDLTLGAPHQAGRRPSSPASPPSPSNPFVLHPLLADHSLLKICQDGDAAELSRYISLLQDRIPTRTVNAADSSGKSGLIYAAMTGNSAMVRLLVKLPNLDVNQADNEGNTALHLAAQAGHADVVSLLTLCPDLKIDQRNDTGLTALMKAALQGRVRSVRLLLLAGASPVLRDFGRRLCSAEWARLTGRNKCAEIIDNYMEKMQLNPGLGYKPPGIASSEPSMLNKRPSSLSLVSVGKTKESWVKSTLRKAAKFVGAGSGTSKDFSIASQLAGSGVFGASVLLPDDSARRSSLPAFADRPAYGSDAPAFQIPRIHVSCWGSTSGGGGGVPQLPSRSPKPIPSESRPAMRSRSRSPSPC